MLRDEEEQNGVAGFFDFSMPNVSISRGLTTVPWGGRGLKSLSYFEFNDVVFSEYRSRVCLLRKGSGEGPRISRLHVTVVESPFVAFGYGVMFLFMSFVYGWVGLAHHGIVVG